MERRERGAPRHVDRARGRAYGQTITRALAILGATAALLAAAGPAHAGFGFLTTWGGAGAAPGQFNTPDGIAVDDLGHVYVADRLNNRVQKFTATGRFLAVLGVGVLDTPYGVAVDGWGDVYVADTHHNRIVKMTPRGRILATWGRGGLGNGEFNDPRAVAVDGAGNVYVADHNNNRVQKLSPTGRFLARWGRNGGDGSAGNGNGEFFKPRGLAIDRQDDIYVADKGNHRIQELGPNGAFIRRWGANGGDGTAGTGNGEFDNPYGVALDGAGNLYATDVVNNRLQRFSTTGAFRGRYGRNLGDGSPGGGPGEFDEPYGVATDCLGNVYVTDEGNNRVEKFGVAGTRAPRCPPKLTFSVQTGQHVEGRRAVRVLIGCDRPCTATLHATVAGMRARAVRRTLAAWQLRRFSIALNAAQLRAMRAGRRALLTVTARGFGGTTRPFRANVDDADRSAA